MADKRPDYLDELARAITADVEHGNPAAALVDARELVAALERAEAAHEDEEGEAPELVTDGGADVIEISTAPSDANREAAEAYRATGEPVRVVDPVDPDRDTGLVSVCVDCSFSYHHGAEVVDEIRVDSHRTDPGREPPVDADAGERHRVALVDVDRGVEIYGPEAVTQHQTGKGPRRVEELRGEDGELVTDGGLDVDEDTLTCRNCGSRSWTVVRIDFVGGGTGIDRLVCRACGAERDVTSQGKVKDPEDGELVTDGGIDAYTRGERYAGDMPSRDVVIDDLADVGLLTERQAAAFVLRDVEGVPRRKVARELEISPDTVDEHLARARRKIAAARDTLEIVDRLDD